MARPVKDGLSYFPKDADFYRDRKIRALIGRFGSDGVILYDYILCEAYRDKGYYMEANEAFIDIAAADLGISPDKIGLILDYLLNKSMLLDGTLFKAVKVLTSRGIQTRWQEAKKSSKRAISVDGELWLLEEAETEGFIKVRQKENFSEKNDSYSGKNKGYSKEEYLNKSKVKEIKGKEDISADKPQTHRFIPPTVEEVRAYCQQRKNRVDPERFVAFYKSKGWMIGKSKMKDWKSAVITWEKGDRRGDSFTSMGQAQDSGRWGKLQSRQLD